MITELERIRTLEEQHRIALRLHEDDKKEIDELKAEVKLLLKDFTETKGKINKAEAWGRGVIWSVIALAGFLSQLSNILTWLKKHVI